MTLPAGTRLGTFEIVAPLGAGGMGEVYRARDSNLDRDVAIKVLPQSVAADPDTLARFEREAKAVAALSHQNILAIHDFGNHDGIAYAVTELLEGETLRAKLEAGPIPQNQAVDYALQIVRGLSAAHGKGIVHRDLKPENLFVTRDDHVKILDFGLAKRVETLAMDVTAPTRSGHTQPGTIMGTAGYMSPEQVKGLPVDHRSDIFSFGAVLYELLSGRRAFTRETTAETMAAIMRDEPPELSESGRNIASVLDRIARHCLEKDRDHRFQSARDIAFNLRELTPSSPAVASDAREITAPMSTEGFRVAVLPFKYGGDNADLTALAEGLSEEIVTGLSRFSYLRVIARSSTARFEREAADIHAAGRALGARYVMEGSLRQAGSALRVAVRLVDTGTGAHLWGETYERTFHPERIFALQDDLVPRIVSTVADWYGVLPHHMGDALRSKASDQLNPYEAVLRSFGYYERMTAEEHAVVRGALEHAVEQAPRNADCWAMLSMVYGDEYRYGFNAEPDPLGRAVKAARRAADAATSNHFAWLALAQALFYRKEFEAFRNAAERAIALNPMDGSTLARMGLSMAFIGDWERGCELAERATQLNPNHPGWYWAASFNNAYRQGDYRGALSITLRMNMPGFFFHHLNLAAVYGQLGDRDAADQAIQELLALKPDFAVEARAEIAKFVNPELVEHMIEGLRKAGLEIPAGQEPAAAAPGVAAPSTTPSGAVRADEGFWVAVLPFKYGGANADLTALADGLSEDIVTGLSRFSYLRVIARSSTSRYAGASVDARAAGKELGARYLMEGNLRQAGTKLRLAVQLVDAVSGAHLWAETYERTFTADAIFELQDDLVPRIVSTVADSHGVLLHSMSDAVRSKSADQLTPYEAVLRSFGYFARVNEDELEEARSALELAVRQAPGYADAWAMLSLLCAQEYGQGYRLRANPLADGATAARRAVEAGSSHHLAHSGLAQVLFLQKEFDAFRIAAARAVALNPMDGATVALMGTLLAYAGDWEEGCALTERAMRLHPYFPGWYRLATIVHAYRTRDYRRALDAALRIQMPGYFWTPVFCAAAYGQLGDTESARKAVAELLAIRPGFGSAAHAEFSKWHDEELAEHFVDGLRKAGLDVDLRQ